MTDILRIFGLWRGRAAWMVAGVVISLAALVAGVGLMAMSGVLIGTAVAAGVLVAPIALRALGAARVVLRYIERLTTHAATFRALADLRVWFFRRLAAGSAGGLGFRQAGDVLGRMVGDVEALDGLYIRILVPLVGALLLLPMLVVLIGEHAPWIAIIVGCLFAVSAFVLPWTASVSASEAGSRLATAAGNLRVAVLDALTGMREVRAFGAEDRVIEAVRTREAALVAAQRDVSRRVAIAGALALLCAQLGILSVLLLAGIEPIAAVAGVFLIVAAFEAAGGLSRAGALAGHAAAAARRVLAVTDARSVVEEPAYPLPLPAEYSLRFEAVDFRWQSDRPPVFRGLSLEIPQGARVALLGASGAGKSSLAALALKVAAPQQGRVLLGGVDIAFLSADALRTRIGWLSQATHLFDDTIRANLLLAKPDADEAAVWSALDAAQIGAFVRTLPDGLDTWVGEGGTRFSGGQGRRVALARALLSPAPILILDEPCAGLDIETEREFLSTLNQAAAGRTVILITHRLIGVERLDRIWRLVDGIAVAAAA
jgi:ATP-binding cassette, subfamily C, bacterial CydC